MKAKYLILSAAFFLLCFAGKNSFAGSKNQSKFNGDVVVSGVRQARISLDGVWKFSLNPPAEFWKNNIDPDSWQDIAVPGDIWAQGFKFDTDMPIAYKQKIEIPADYKGQRILLHFDAVHNLATVWVNGVEVTTHQGGFTPWDCDITEYVEPGKSSWIALRVTDLKREISFNGKAQRAIGGLTRSVELRARPMTFFQLPIVSSPFDDEFQNATLKVVGRVTSPTKKATASFRLFDPSGKEVKLPNTTIPLDKEVASFTVPVEKPIQWDAEHPNLYRLEITVKAPGQSTASYSKQIGFRDIRFDTSNNLLINGKIVKLRGANRHLSNPTGGKVPTSEYEQLDTELAKEANLNFFRTSHYPPGTGLLDNCDQLGIYVTVESAIVDAGKSIRPSKDMQDDTASTKHFLSQLEEMLLNYGSHPSAIIWSTANESVYGLNFLESYKLCKELDPSRPVIASYQMKEDDKHESYDVKSSHYPKWNRDFTQVEMPTIYDEWMHVPGHGANEWIHDPNGRDYWGRSLDKAWTNLFPADGSIGGAIWNYIDDVTYLPDPIKITGKGPHRFVNPEDVRMATPVGTGNVFGVARWGIIDEWRRKKPEFWNTKKAYSPIKLLTREVSTFEEDKPLVLPVQNRFDHTDLGEISMKVSYNGKSKIVKCASLAPHATGELKIPADNWQTGTELGIEFLDPYQRVVDIYTIAIGNKEPAAINLLNGGAQIEKHGNQLQISGEQFTFDINMETGLFESYTTAGVKQAFVGPYLHLYQLEEYFHESPENNQVRGMTTIYDGPELATWKLKSIAIDEINNIVHVAVKGNYAEIEASYTYIIGNNGRLDVDYAFSNIPALETPNKIREGEGPLTLEAGIKFQMNDAIDELAWKRKGYWSYYPEGHLGALSGRVPMFTEKKPVYRQYPDQPWEMDVHDWFYQGVNVPEGKLMPNIARAARLGIYEYSLIDKESKTSLTVYGNGINIAGRFNQAADMNYYLFILDTLDYHLRWGNYSAQYRPETERKGKVQLILKSTEL